MYLRFRTPYMRGLCSAAEGGGGGKFGGESGKIRDEIG